MVSIIDAQRPALLSVSGTRLWSGQNAQLFRGTSIAWGALGPQMFAWGSTYYMVPLSLFLGLFLPLPFYFLHRRRPKAGWNNLSTPVMLQYACFMSVGINTSVNPSMVIGIFSQYFVRRKVRIGCTLPDLRGLNTDACPPLLFSHAAQFPKLFTKVRNVFLSIKGHQQSDSLLSASTTTSSRLLSTEEHRPLASFSISPSLAPLARPTTSLSGYVAEPVLHLPLPSTDSHRVHRLVGQP